MIYFINPNCSGRVCCCQNGNQMVTILPDQHGKLRKVDFSNQTQLWQKLGIHWAQAHFETISLKGCTELKTETLNLLLQNSIR